MESNIVNLEEYKTNCKYGYKITPYTTSDTAWFMIDLDYSLEYEEQLIEDYNNGE